MNQVQYALCTCGKRAVIVNGLAVCASCRAKDAMKHSKRSGCPAPHRDGFSDVLRACNRWEREKGFKS